MSSEVLVAVGRRASKGLMKVVFAAMGFSLGACVDDRYIILVRTYIRGNGLGYGITSVGALGMNAPYLGCAVGGTSWHLFYWGLWGVSV